EGMTNSKKPGLAFWATVVCLVILGYGVSLGPGCWVTSQTGVGTSVVDVVYRPIILVADACPFSAWGIIQWYSGLGAASDWCWSSEHSWRHETIWESLEREGMLPVSEVSWAPPGSFPPLPRVSWAPSGSFPSLPGNVEAEEQK